MATGIETSRNCCFICQKGKSTYRCDGCLKSYCKNHLNDHQEELLLQLDEIENERNIFRQTLSEQIKQPNKQQSIQQINQWEQYSIKKIQQTAEENRQLILKEINQHFENIEIDLKSLTKEIKEIRQENDFNELNLNDLRNKLEQLGRKLNNVTDISVREEDSSSSSFINRIVVDIGHCKISNFEMLNIPTTLKWKQNAVTVAGGNGEGEKLNQLSNPYSIYIDNDDETIYVTDMDNHRIVAWMKNATCGKIVAGGNGQGNGKHQLCYPAKVIIDKMNDCLIIADRGNTRVVHWPRNSTCGQTIIENIACIDLVMHKNQYLYVSDEQKHEVRRWKRGSNGGILVAGGNGCGNDLNQLNSPHFMFIDQDDTLYVSDFGNNRVMKWMKDAKEGTVVAGGNGKGTSLKQLSSPQGIFVDRLGTLYIANANNDRIIRWIKDAKNSSLIAGGNQRGNQSNQFNTPIGLSFDKDNNLYVVDCHNHRIQKFIVDNYNYNFV